MDNLTGLHHALIAVSFFRARNRLKRRFRNARKPHHQRLMISRRVAMVRAARHHIAQARALGWRGSILGAIGVDHG